MYENELRALLTNAGADLVGFSCLRDELPEELKKYGFPMLSPAMAGIRKK